ncbi:MAG: alpha/beta fold hydrolase [Candidatus Promineifilaceae bacterium]|nr:alpha/beta fold hydrolase [Candidatus Promineifilaceae bacterium]
MHLFGRVIRLFLLLLAFLLGLVAALVAFIARQMINPQRQRLWATPADAGMDYEEVEFPARDGLRLSGWFIPTPEGTPHGAPIVLVHGWPWNRLGEAAADLMASVSGALPVDLLRLAHALHSAGHPLLMFDLRNHGQSASGGPVTFGLHEANDLLGALDFLDQRSEVEAGAHQVGVVGFSLGANTILYTLPHTDRIGAAVAVQPTSAPVFAPRYATDLLGPLGKPVLRLAEQIYQAAGGPPLSALEPAFVATAAGDTPVLYVQGKGDRWGSVSNVAHMAARTPAAVPPLFVDSDHRFGGYRHVVDNPAVLLDFFARHLAPENRSY